MIFRRLFVYIVINRESFLCYNGIKNREGFKQSNRGRECVNKTDCCEILRKIYESGECERVGLEIRVESAVLHKWLAGKISVQSFNKIIGGGYLGVSTGNLVAYSLLVISGEDGKESQRSFPSDKIYTINWYGTQRHWWREWEWLLREGLESGSRELVDCFGGSGFIGLLGAKLGYERVWLNDLDAGLYNYHLVMKDEVEFEKFKKLITATGFPDREIMQMVDRYLEEEEEKRFQRINWKKAVYLFYQKHYKKVGIGSVNTDKKAIGEYEKELEKTHGLYDKKLLKEVEKERELEKMLFVFDPPFLGGNHRGYNKRFTEGQHLGMMKVVARINRMENRIVVVGFDNEMYKEWLERKMGFRKIEFKRESVNGKRECVWINWEVSGGVWNVGIDE